MQATLNMPAVAALTGEGETPLLPRIFAIVMLFAAIVAATYVRRSATPPTEQARPAADQAKPATAPVDQMSKPNVRPEPPVRVIVPSPYEARPD
jgi:hypothetical protein